MSELEKTEWALMVEMADRFREWSRTEYGATVCRGVAEGSFKWENELVSAFIAAVDPETEAV
jgi:hypothetical protein